MKEKQVKLSEYARLHGIQYRAAWNRYRAGKIPGATMENGHIVVPDPLAPDALPVAAIYARVSTAGQRDDLKRQSERLQQFASANGYPIVHVVEEVASGVNDNRPKLTRLLEKDDWNALIVEHKDRLTRVGFQWFDVLLKKQGKSILVVDRATDDTRDLMDDFTSIIYSFCARLYGQRGHRSKAARVVAEVCANNDEERNDL